MNKGDYVRTRWGYIAKFEGINEGFYEFDNIIMDESSAVRENLFVDIVEKSSPNIIDLIEVGDYVNGYKVNVIQIWKDETALICNDYNLDDSAVLLTNKDIKTIVTKEQFSAMEYKVESEVK